VKPVIPKEWLEPASLKQAADIQRHLAARVIEETTFRSVSLLGGVDISHAFRKPDEPIHAAVALLDPDDLSFRGTAEGASQARFPYVPGFLGFREVPALLAPFRKLHHPPDLVLVDGHGRAHPRGLGIACHLGVALDLPTIGVAKTILVGEPRGTLGPRPGDSTPLVWRGRTIGMVLRTKARCNPLYISIGHRITLEDAVAWVLRCLKGYRHPEPVRYAHLAANHARRTHEGGPNRPLF
jgi:deoxyribonuclease V